MPKQIIGPLEAKRYLAEASPAWKAFWFHNGPVVRSLSQMAATLPKVSPEMFAHHVAGGKNDIAAWIDDVIGDQTLAADLAKARAQAAMCEILGLRVKELEGILAVLPKVAPTRNGTSARTKKKIA